jgi:serine/threonine-protein kinase HipA
VENEHACLELAGALGLPAARSRVVQFEDQIAIVVERYDRLRTDTGFTRIHQEDLCQALGIPPTHKYENEGGPGVDAVVDLLRSNSRAAAEDIETLVGALALNWIIGGTDGHAKNYSILIGEGGTVRLAPLYDIASALPYPSIGPYSIKLAMKIGGEYLVRKIGRRQWEKLARQVQMAPDDVLFIVRRIATRSVDGIHYVCQDAKRDGLSHPVLDRIEREVTTRAESCLAELDTPASTGG